jgi:hypothetical protein
MSMSEVQEKEIIQLEKLLDERRAAGVKGAYPAKLRKRIVRLWRSGSPMKELSERLGIAASMLYAWGKKDGDGARPPEAAVQVLQVEAGAGPVASEPAAAGELRLQLGMFSITVNLAGA